MPPNLKSVRVLIPRARRALEGPMGSASASPGATLSDQQVEQIVADALASLIFYSGGSFGRRLLVVERDEDYGAPISWETDEELTESEVAVTMAEVALSYFLQLVKDLKIQETISNEGQSWQWATSANAILEWLKHLREQRKLALDGLRADAPVTDAFFSFMQARDARVASAIEPFTRVGGVGGLNEAEFELG